MKVMFFIVLFVEIIFSSPMGYIGSFDTKKYDILKKDNHLITASSGGVELYDYKTSTDNAKLISKWDEGYTVYKIIDYGNVLIGEGKDEVYFFNFIDNKIKLYKTLHFDKINDIVLGKNYLYVIRDKMPSVILDMDDNEKEVAELPKVDKWYYRAYIKNNILVVTNYLGGFDVYDIKDPLNPLLLSEKKVADGGGFSLYIDDDNKLYIAGDLYVYIYDITDPINIKEIKKIKNKKLTYYHIYAQDGKIVGIDGRTSSRIGIIDINSSDSQYYDIGLNNSSYSWVRDNNDKKIFYACVDDGIKKINLNDYKDIKIDKIYDMPIVSKTILKDGYLFVDGTFNGVFIYKINNDTNLTFVKKIDEEDSKYGHIQDILIDKNNLYITYNYAFFIYDISNPLSPKFVSKYELTSNGSLDTSHGDFLKMKIDGNILYISKYDKHILYAFDISEVSSPTLLGILDLKATVSIFDIVGKYLYIKASSDYIIVVDISDPNNPTFTQKYYKANTSHIYSLSHIGDTLFVGTLYNLKIYHIDINTGELTAAFQLPLKAISDMKIKGKYLFASSVYHEGFHILNIQDTNKIFEVSKPNDYMATSFNMSDNYLYLTDNGIKIVDVDDLFMKDSISFYKGWNLKALPVLEDIDAQKLNCKLLWKWDDVDNQWKFFTNDANYTKILKSSNFKEFSTIYPAEGFWAYCDKNSSIELKGQNYNIDTSAFQKGWYLVGFGENVNIDSIDKQNIKIMWGYKKDGWHCWANDTNTSFPILNDIKSDDGIWIEKR